MRNPVKEPGPMLTAIPLRSAKRNFVLFFNSMKKSGRISACFLGALSSIQPTLSPLTIYANPHIMDEVSIDRILLPLVTSIKYP